MFHSYGRITEIERLGWSNGQRKDAGVAPRARRVVEVLDWYEPARQ